MFNSEVLHQLRYDKSTVFPLPQDEEQDTQFNLILNLFLSMQKARNLSTSLSSP